ncbi:MAG: protein-glutamate O-methyltransferase CheR [Bdellovibrionaceae bacterium]|nr:protein-glutamate O-methyltransferase CheR [Pseudobdellovibrionaceae bacterium]
MNVEIFNYFSKFIEKELGIVYSDFNQFQLQARLEEVAKSLSLPSIEAVYEEVRRGMLESRKQVLLDIATNNETSFFRDKSVFDAIQAILLSDLGKNHKVKIWSAASSYGQEAYSVSMILSELTAQGHAVNGQILATDIAERVLARAKTGRFTQLEVQRGLSAPFMLKYFSTDGEGWWKINATEKQRVSFAKQNLRQSFVSLGTFDIILCRNVLIYQSVEGKKDVVDRMAQILNPGGYLILGSGESLLGLSQNFESKKVNNVIVYQKAALASKLVA